jgi:galactose mutarotase-like enzyme
VRTTWLGQPALVLETDALRLITVPRMGAKIVSLFDKRANREWLLPPTNREFKPVAYGSSFVDQDMSGWDEIFPTTDTCLYPVDGKYKGNPLPDHGEVWALPWEVEAVTDDRIQFAVMGRALPYRLTRTAQVMDAHRIRMLFEVVNMGDEPLAALWSAHPQFAVDAETRIRLPNTVKEVVNVHQTEDWRDVEGVYGWATAQGANGQLHHLDVIRSADLRKCRKFFVLPEEQIGWAALQQGDHGAWVRLRWDAACVPYFALWVDEGTYNPVATAALEPTTGYYDRLDRAWEKRCAMHLIPHTPVRWHLDIELGSGTLENL